MHISLTTSGANGFKKWSNDHPPSNDDESPGGAMPIAIVELPSEPAASEGSRHRPWVVPGVGGSF